MASSDQALGFAWDEYRRAARRARLLKRQVDRVRLGLLALLIVGSVCALLSDQLQGFFEEGFLTSAPNVLAIVGALALGLVAFGSKALLDSDLERQWILCRSQAEALKSESYKYALRVAPYAGLDAAEQLTRLAVKLAEAGPQTPPVDLAQDAPVRPPPVPGMTVPQYCEQRVRQQIESF